ncbi:60s ribosomal protein l21-1 [Plasmopara halstedii]|uniref:PIH1 domain-containing protein 1 n=1 Tax=Plasmopara halstedii TaxID=4781 RepID=A0A0P1AXB6_PLAHL|nr:60s ribosomal protein l21-1 [Plasmopara halstedii]CEG45938.1 60s ribosomal protein l21-1 [Plasmopara halstedii]|eukprot:XP_024582307.1 60s ribosomal protein l21-1 [Plasmopara halstedii]
MFARPFRQSGVIKMSTYLRTFKVGDYVDIKANGAIHKGMPHKFYHGRTGRVYNVTKRAVGVRVNKVVGNRVIHKHINENELKKKEARATGVRAQIKRTPALPKAAYTLKTNGVKPITMAAQPFVDLIGVHSICDGLAQTLGLFSNFNELNIMKERVKLFDIFTSIPPFCAPSPPPRMNMPMDDASMEKYADFLDNLEKTDPEGYRHLIDTMQNQLQAAEDPINSSGVDADGALLDILKNVTEVRGGAANIDSPDFNPRFPGDKVMGKDGLKTSLEGMYIEVKAGFVIKTTDVKSRKKVFVNVVYADEIQEFSGKKKLDDEGKEQEGIHVPLSLGAPHEVKDKNGVESLAFDVAVNTKVVDDCRADKSGAFRNFVCELAIEYIDQKYKIKLDGRFKLPRLTYRGELPPPRHYIRKTQAPIIQEVTADKTIGSKNSKAKAALSKSAKTATAKYEIYEVYNGNRLVCTRLPSVSKGSTPLSQEVLEQAQNQLVVVILFPNKIYTANDIQLELHAELLSIKAPTHHDLDVFLPYPVDISSASVCFNQDNNALEMSLVVDKSWNSIASDCGSAPWLLARALHEDNEVEDGSNVEKAADLVGKNPMSLVEKFHLVNTTKSHDKAIGDRLATKATPRWDPVLEDEELPEDRFHRKDMMSMHILEQRRAEREQKAKEADQKQRQRRAEVESMQRKAAEAGKTWREMYPNEPETTYIDVEEIVRQEKERLDRHLEKKKMEEEDPSSEFMPTEDAIRAAMKWSESRANRNLDLQSALAFDLL